MREQKIEFREVRLNYMIIAKASNQSVNHVEKAISDLVQHLITMITQSEGK